jgi:Flp pilus assembly protein TadG
MTGRQRTNRSGTTSVEFAVVAPMVFLLFFTAFELSRLNMIRHTAEVAAYEGARRGIVPGATAEHVRGRVAQVLGAVGVQNMTITVQPEVLTQESREVSVHVSIPLAENAWIVPNVLDHVKDIPIESTSVMTRETF